MATLKVKHRLKSQFFIEGDYMVREKHLYRDEIKKLLITYGVSFMAISIVLVFSFFLIYTNFIVRNINEKSNELVKDIVSQEINEYVKAIHRLESEEAIINFLKEGDDQADVYELLYKFISDRNVKSIFYIVDPQGNTVLTNNYIESPYNSYDIFLSGVFKQLKVSPDDIVYMNNKVQIDITKRTIYSIGKSIKVDGEIKGYLIFDILESDLYKILHESNVDILVITDKYNNGIITTNSLLLNDIGKFKLTRSTKDTMRFIDKEYYFYKSELLDGEMYLYTLSELELITNLMKVSMIYGGIFFIFITVVIIKVADYASKKKTESIKILIDSISKAQKGDLEAFVSINSNDEFEMMGEQFNKMLVELDRLMEKNNELVDRNRIAEIKQLESQFNPHFIFNTLETLKYMIHINKEKASEIVVNFAIILRYSIDYEKKNIQLDQDLDYLNSYLLIQKYRYNKRLTYDLRIDKLAKDCIVPKLIMQPIIENCINHGYKSKETLHIDLDISIVNGKLLMIIEDNGDGISEKELDSLREHLENTNTHSNSIGLNNVNRRLKLLFGEEYGLGILSQKGKGTIVTIKMPIEKGL